MEYEVIKLLKQNEKSTVDLLAPADPHWDGETGTGLWGRVPESGVGEDERYDWRLYRCDTETPPDMERDAWEREGTMRGNLEGQAFFNVSLAEELGENGFYYFAVRASGDGVTYADSPYVLSDVFAYTGKDAPSLPAPEGLYWDSQEKDGRTSRSGRSLWMDRKRHTVLPCRFSLHGPTSSNQLRLWNPVRRRHI